MASKTAPRGEAPARHVRSDRKVYIGFWTWPENKDAIQKIARRRRQSVSAFIDETMEDCISRERRWHR